MPPGPGPDWFDGVTLERVIPNCLGRACWETARWLVAARRNRLLPDGPSGSLEQMLLERAPQSTVAERRAALALAELAAEWAARKNGSVRYAQN